MRFSTSRGDWQPRLVSSDDDGEGRSYRREGNHQSPSRESAHDALRESELEYPGSSRASPSTSLVQSPTRLSGLPRLGGQSAS